MVSISNRLTMAGRYTEHKYALTPLKGKTAYKDAWQDTKYDIDADLSAYANQNFGVVLKDDDLVIDVDPRNFEEGDNPVTRLVKDICSPLVSFTVKTGGGGIHIYLKKPKDIKIRKNIKNYPGLDFLSKGCQVVGAGSIHPETEKEYKILAKSLGEISPAPTKLLDILERNSDDMFSGIGLEKFIDDTSSCNRYSLYLKENAEIATEGNGGDKTTFVTACRGRDFGLTPNKTYELMSMLWNPRCMPPWDEEELMRKVQNAYVYNQDVIGKNHPASNFDIVEVEGKVDIKWDVTTNDQLKKTLANTVNFFTMPDSDLKNMISFNEFTNDIEFLREAPWHKGGYRSGATWSDSDAIQCKYYLASVKHFEISTNLIHEAVVVVARHRSYHPVKMYLDSLEWDGVSRLDRWLVDYAGVNENAYSLNIGRKVLVAAVARVFDPGVKFDYMLVLEGKQGVFKSTLCAVLGKSWFGDITLDTQSKDTVDAMRGKWIIEISEMECTKKAETQALKAFISRQCDRVRLAYARNTADFPRQCIFIGTINPEAVGYLKDTTGNRRFWPVYCGGKIRINELRRDMDQIWAEAKLSYELGEKLYLDNKEAGALAMDAVSDRLEDDPWAYAVEDWLNTPDEEGALISTITSSEILTSCIGIPTSMINKIFQRRIATIMVSTLKWDKGAFYDTRASTTIRGYKRPEGQSIPTPKKVDQEDELCI